MQAKANLLLSDEFGTLVAMRVVTELVRAACLDVLGPVEVRIEDERFRLWDDLTATFLDGGTKRIEAWQIKRQTAGLQAETIAEMMRSLHEQPQISVAHFAVLDLVEVAGVEHLRVLRAICERLGRGGLDFDVLTDTLNAKERRWVKFIDGSIGQKGPPDVLRLLTRLRIEPVGSEEAHRQQVVTSLGAVFADPEAAFAVLREDLRRRLDSTRAITWELIADLPGLGRRIVPLQQLLERGIEPLGPDPTPGDLLRADSQVLPFTGRKREIDELEQLLAQKQSTVVLLVGPGGSGKTRLLVEWCQRLRHRGKVAGFLPRRIDSTSMNRLLAESEECVVVVDYAETRVDQVIELLECVAMRQNASGPVLVVLLARNQGDWWRDMGNTSYRMARMVARCRPCMELPGLMLDLAERNQFFIEAARRFAAIRGVPVPRGELPSLTATQLAHPLYLQMAALAWIDGNSISADDALLEYTLGHETRYWTNAVAGLGLPSSESKLLMRALRRLVTAATLWGGIATCEIARTRAERIGTLPHGRPDLVTSLLDVAFNFYGSRRTGGPWVSALEPDLLGEHLVVGGLAREDDLLALVLDEATRDEQRHVLTMLTRIAQRIPSEIHWLITALKGRLATLGESAIGVAIETGDPIGFALAEAEAEVDDGTLLQHLFLACPSNSVALLEFRAVLAKHLLAIGTTYEEARAEFSIGLPFLAAALARQLHELRNDGEALPAIEFAVKLQRQLASLDPVRHLAALAHYLTLHGTILRALGREEEGFCATTEAVEIARRTQAQDELLAHCLNNLAVQLVAANRLDEALTAILESVALRRSFAASGDYDKLQGLAASLRNHATILAKLVRTEESLSGSLELVALSRQLYELQPDAHGPQFATDLTNASCDFDQAGHIDNAVAALLEAAKIREQFAVFRPYIFLPGLANNLRGLLGLAKRRGQQEMIAPLNERLIHTLRRLHQLDEKYAEELAHALCDAALQYSKTGEYASGLAWATEGVELFRALVKRDPAPYRDALAARLNDLADDLRLSGRPSEAVAVAREAVEIYRTIEGVDAVRALALTNLALALADAQGPWKEIEKCLLEAEVVYRDLCKSDSLKYEPRLYGGLRRRAIYASERDDHAAAVMAYQEAVAIARHNLARAPELHTQVAEDLIMLAIHAAALGDQESALRATQESIDLCRTIEASEHCEIAETLGFALNNLAELLADKDPHQAFAARTEGLQLLAQHPDTLPPELRIVLRQWTSKYNQECTSLGLEPNAELLTRLSSAAQLNFSQLGGLDKDKKLI